MVRELVMEKKKKNKELVEVYAKNLLKELQDYCKELVGHNFTNWEDDSWIGQDGYYDSSFIRYCNYCGKYNFKRKDSIEKILWISELDLEKCVTEADEPYSPKTLYKVPLVGSITFNKDDLIVIRTDVKDYVAYVQSVLEDHLKVHIF